MKRALLLVVLLIGPAGGASAYGQGLERSMDAVVRIVSRSGGHECQAAGLVVAIAHDQAYIVTVAHAVSGRDLPPVVTVEFRGYPGELFPAALQHREPYENGLALLLVNAAKKLPDGMRALSPSPILSIAPGNLVTVLGHPVDAEWC